MGAIDAAVVFVRILALADRKHITPNQIEPRMSIDIVHLTM
jgi:hypothetical protein